MSHPVELLVALEDGTLLGSERAVLEAHLHACARCREEVQTATAGRGALRGLEAGPMPHGLLDGVLAEANERVSEVPGVTSITARTARWQRVVAVAGVAAAIVLVASLALPNLATPTRTATLGAESAGGASAPSDLRAASTVEIVDQDYDLAGVSALATSFKAAAADGVAAPAESTAYLVRDAPRELEPAKTCLRAAFVTLPGEPVELLRARYLRQPAYFGFFLIGPGADEPPTAVRILIASVDGCALLGSSQADLP